MFKKLKKIEGDAPSLVKKKSSSKDFAVRGRLLYADGQPVSGVKVEVFDIHLDKDISIGKGNTNEKGEYEILYSTEDLFRVDEDKPDIIIRAYDEKNQIIASSPVIIEPARDQVVELIYNNEPFRGFSEFKQHKMKLKSILNDKSIEEIKADRFFLLSKKLGINPRHLTYLIQSLKLKNKSKIPAKLFYGLFRQNLPTDIGVLITQDSKTLQKCLINSMRQNIINIKPREFIESNLKKLYNLKLNLIKEKLDQDKGVFSSLLNTLGISAENRKMILDRYFTHKGPAKEFWNNMKEEKVLGEETVKVIENLQFTLQLGVLTLNNIPLVQELQRKEFEFIRDLTKYSFSDWEECLKSGTVKVPDSIPGDNDDEKKNNYIKTIIRTLEIAFPTDMLINQIKGNFFYASARDIKEFFNNHQDFDIRTSSIETYKDVSKKIKNQIQVIRRLFTITPRFEKFKTIETLMSDKVHSAYSIRLKGKSAFVNKYEKRLGKNYAQQIYSKASQIYSLTINLFARHSASMNKTQLRVLPNNYDFKDANDKNKREVTTRTAASTSTEGSGNNRGNNNGNNHHGGGEREETTTGSDSITDTGDSGDGNPGVEIPNWRSIFGPFELCECEHCRSIHSPAAYLVDLLAFLDKHQILEVLYQRRSDLGNIELNCENTNTMLPYVDLVNEVLENIIIKINSPDTRLNWTLSELLVVASQADTKNQTEWGSNELRVEPEHLEMDAYNILKGVSYPWILPFNLWAEESRVYLNHLGIPRHEIMDIFRLIDEANKTRIIATEALNLEELDYNYIFESNVSTPENWGMSDADWVNKLKIVSLFLKKANIKYKELLTLLETRFIDPNKNIKVSFPNVDCNIEEATIDNLSEVELGHIKRFLRLQKKLEWSTRHLDAAINTFPLDSGKLRYSHLEHFYFIKELKKLVKVPFLEMLSWWASIDTLLEEEYPTLYEKERSLYDNLFLNRTTRRFDPDNDIFILNNTGTELKDTTGILDSEDVMPIILAALRINAEDLSLLIENSDVLNKIKELNLSNLSLLHRVATLARALKLSVEDFLILRNLSNIDPFVSPEKTKDFVKLAQLVKQSKFKLIELDYLLRDNAQANSPVKPYDEEISQLLSEIRGGLQKIAEEYGLSPDPTGERTSQLLSIVLSETIENKEEIVGNAIKLINGPPPTSSMQDEINKQKSLIDEYFKDFLDVEEAKAKLVDPGDLTNIDERFSYVLDALLTYLKQQTSENFVIQKIADVFKLELEASDLILKSLLPSLIEPTRKTLYDFLASAFVDSGNGEDNPITSDNFGEYFTIVRRLDKNATLVNGFNLPSEELEWIYDVGPTLGWLDMRNLPLQPEIHPPVEMFERWERMAEMKRLNKDWPSGEPTIYVLLRNLNSEDMADDDFREDLNARVGWNIDDLEFLMGSNGYNLAFPDNYKSQDGLERLILFNRAFKITKRIGASAEQIWGWNTHFINMEQANNIKQAVKSKYEDDKWIKIAEPLRNNLRKKQRQALVDYFVFNTTDEEFDAANDLFGVFLIDIEMDPCMLTSRIKQALSSVQLFIQRCLMGLEQPTATLSTDAAEEWKWMKNYRVWEVNRKIFLYPENWIEPELRDDKSPFFIDLENELLQRNITDETVELPFLNYLEKLDEVGRLDISGMFYDKDTSNPDEIDETIHVFGRTQTKPYIYYYRKLINQAYWTPWERVGLDIEEDYVIPIFYNRRIFLFWPIFKEKKDRSQGLPDTPEEPKRYYEIDLAWSEYRNGKWQAKKISENPIGDFCLRGLIVDTMKTKFTFRGSISGNDLFIYCYYNKGSTPTYQCYFGYFYFNVCKGSLEGYTLHENIFLELLLEHTISNVLFIRNDIPPRSILENMRFSESGRDINEDHIRFTLDTNITISTNEEDLNINELRLIVGEVGPYREEGCEWLSEMVANRREEEVLLKTPGYFRITTPHQDWVFISQSPFFYVDNNRVFFITTKKVTLKAAGVGAVGEAVGVAVGGVAGAGVAGAGVAGAGVAVGGAGVGAVGIAVGGVAGVAGVAGAGAGVGAVGIVVGAVGAGVAGESGVGEAGVAGVGVGAVGIVVGAVGAGVAGESGAGAVEIVVGAGVVGAGVTGAVKSVKESLKDGDALRFEYLVEKSLEITRRNYCFRTFYHPYTCLFIKQVYRYGIEGLLNPKGHTDEVLQLQRQKIKNEYFKLSYDPSARVKTPFPFDDIDFNFGGAYSHYNWELFFHAPFLIATRLSQNQRFEEAQKWFHYIFDPTDVTPDEDTPERYWKVRPLYEEASKPSQSIKELIMLLNTEVIDLDEDSPFCTPSSNLLNQVTEWRKNPFKPHVVARLRWVAYQKAVIIKYLDNLIAWGDYLFRSDTIESINEATQLYILAAEILGKRAEDIPVDRDFVPTINGVEVKTFNDIRDKVDIETLSNPIVELETLLPTSLSLPDTSIDLVDSPILGPTFFFCIPENDKLLEYWDKVADRLFKIRHCMNIEGIVRELPLFQPPIDPAILIRAAAAGIDISSALNDLSAPLPYYRFNFMLQKAIELTNDVKGLGGALLSALEKQDAEKLALLRSSHEIELLKSIKDIKKQQVKEAEESLAALNVGKESAESRKQYYESREYMNANEKLYLKKLREANKLRNISQGLQALRAVLALIPFFDIGAAGISSPLVKVAWGGINLSNTMDAAAQGVAFFAQLAEQAATMASIKGGYDRRMTDWTFQAEQAEKDISQFKKQIAGAEIRCAITENELTNHEKQIENTNEIDSYMRDKFTNEQLYSWMISQISSIYFQSYQLAYDLAKRAEKSFQYELSSDKSFIQFGYWDSLKKGLLAGEKLFFDLKRMESAYQEQNRREYELTKNISLVLLDPVALTLLKETGQCIVTIPEAVFDLDYPGHYLRRIKSLSLTIPCVTGPYTTVSCTCTMLKSELRINTNPKGVNDGTYRRDQNNSDDRFRDDIGAIQSIATSSARNDSGLFELNFRDERYLPFEGKGVISQWRLELPSLFRQFDFNTIVDVIFQMRYTSRDGGTVLKDAAITELVETINSIALGEEGERTGLFRMLSAKYHFADAWHEFLNPTDSDPNPPIAFDLSIDRFPYVFHKTTINITRVEVLLHLKPEFVEDGDGFMVVMNYSGTGTDNKLLNKDELVEGIFSARFDLDNKPEIPVAFLLEVTEIPTALKLDGTNQLNPDVIEDIAIICYYSISIN